MKKPTAKAVKELCATLTAATLASLQNKRFREFVNLAPGVHLEVLSDKGMLDALFGRSHDQMLIVSATDESEREPDTGGNMPEVKLTGNTEIFVHLVRVKSGQFEIAESKHYRDLGEKGLTAKHEDENEMEQVPETAAKWAEVANAFATLYVD